MPSSVALLLSFRSDFVISWSPGLEGWSGLRRPGGRQGVRHSQKYPKVQLRYRRKDGTFGTFGTFGALGTLGTLKKI